MKWFLFLQRNAAPLVLRRLPDALPSDLFSTGSALEVPGFEDM